MTQLSRRRFALAGATLPLAAALGRVARPAAAQDEKPDKIKLDYAYYNPSSLVLRRNGWLEEDLAADGIEVEWVLSAGSNKANEFLKSDAIDFGSTAGAAALLAKANGSEIQTVYIFSKPEWAALVVGANSEITDVAGIKGKKVAATKGTDPFFFLRLAAVPELPEGHVDANREATTPLPLWLQQPGGANWYQHLPDTRALYVGFQSVRDGEDSTLAAFFDRVFAEIEREEIDRLVLDIRLNGGGNNLLNQPLIHHIIRCDRINRWGGLFAIIGRQTFSAAMNLAVDLERHTRVIFAGEPTGSSPNHYGEVGEIILPHSNLRVIASVLYWQISMPFDDRPWLRPELPAWLSLDDYLANRDPALDAVLNWRPGQTLPLEYPDRLIVQLLGSNARTGAG